MDHDGLPGVVLVLFVCAIGVQVYLTRNTVRTVHVQGEFFTRGFENCLRVEREEHCGVYILDDAINIEDCNDYVALGKNEAVHVVLVRRGVWPFVETSISGIAAPCRYVDHGPTCGIPQLYEQQRIYEKKWGAAITAP